MLVMSSMRLILNTTEKCSDKKCCPAHSINWTSSCCWLALYCTAARVLKVSHQEMCIRDVQLPQHLTHMSLSRTCSQTCCTVLCTTQCPACYDASVSTLYKSQQSSQSRRLFLRSWSFDAELAASSTPGRFWPFLAAVKNLFKPKMSSSSSFSNCTGPSRRPALRSVPENSLSGTNLHRQLHFHYLFRYVQTNIL